MLIHAQGEGIGNVLTVMIGAAKVAKRILQDE